MSKCLKMLAWIALVALIVTTTEAAECPAGATANSYTLVGLGHQPVNASRVWESSFGRDINDEGQVTGDLRASSGQTNRIRAFVWDPVNGMVELATRPTLDFQSFGIAINGPGQIVGFGTGRLIHIHPVLWEPNENEITDLLNLVSPPGCFGGRGAAHDINDAGRVVGIFSNRCVNIGRGGGFVWDPATGVLARPGRKAHAINNLTQVVGESVDGFSRDTQAFFWDPISGTVGLSRLAVPDLTRQDTALDINDASQVVGFAHSTDGRRAVLWDPIAGTVAALASFSGPPFDSAAGSINEAGHIVGHDNGAPTIWYSVTEAHRLDDLVDASADGWVLGVASINNPGQIVGTGTNPSGQTEAFVLNPVCSCEPPDPALVDVDNGGALELFEGTITEVMSSGETRVSFRIDPTDVIRTVFGGRRSIGLWFSINAISFDPDAVTVEPDPADTAFLNFTEAGVIPPDGQASYIARFCKPGEVTFRLEFDELAIALTLVEKFPFVENVREIATGLLEIPLFESAVAHYLKAWEIDPDVSARSDFAELSRELRAATSDLLRLATNREQAAQFVEVFALAGVDVTFRKLFRELKNVVVVLPRLIIDVWKIAGGDSIEIKLVAE